MVSHGSGSAMVASVDDAPLPSDNSSSRRGKSKNSRGQNSGTGRKGGSGRGSGSGKITGGRGNSARSSGGQQQWTTGSGGQQQFGHWQWVPQPRWAAPPPCPYPTASWARPPPVPPRQQGILGPPPAQQLYTAAVASPGSYVPTDIESAMHTMTLNPPDQNWYMDTGATSHMTSSDGFSDGEATNAV
ncbi:uncharacterized protein LOC132050862 [Lycium ferocissimum]|uniref:uncharacterized protein LOC132050862 n=1 Tax=Lycium ferocissimum TaxID=112874 RepID=UPI002814B5B6|nr:uncharacterized protein LOC132050862 [Lycium ferocissimum]